MNPVVPTSNRPQMSDDRLEYQELRRRFAKFYDEEAEIRELLKNWKRPVSPVAAEVKSEVPECSDEASSSTPISEAAGEGESDVNVEVSTSSPSLTSEVDVDISEAKATIPATLKSENADESGAVVPDLTRIVEEDAMKSEDIENLLLLETKEEKESVVNSKADAEEQDEDTKTATLKSVDPEKSEAIVSDVKSDPEMPAILTSEDSDKSGAVVPDLTVIVEEDAMKSEDIENLLLLETKEEEESVVNSKADAEEQDEDTKTATLKSVDPEKSETIVSDVTLGEATLKSVDPEKSETIVSDVALGEATLKSVDPEKSETFVSDVTLEASTLKSVDPDESEEIVSGVNLEAELTKSENVDKSKEIVSDVKSEAAMPAILKSEAVVLDVNVEEVAMQSEDIENPLLLETTKEEAESVVKAKAGAEEEDEDTGALISFWGIH